MPEVKSKRISILTEAEIDELYALPKFTQKEREEYFSLDEEILREVRSMRKTGPPLYLILLIGYFRAKPVLLTLQFKDVQADLEYIRDTHFPGRKIPKKDLPKSTKHKLAMKMLSLVGYSRFNRQQHLPKLSKRLEDVATIHAEAKYVFDECLAFFGQERIALPGYTTLQDIITVTLSSERKRIESILAKKMTILTKERLLEILNTHGLLNSLSTQKGSAKDFSPTDVGNEIATHSAIKEIYSELKSLIRHLELSQGNLAFYASIVRHKTVSKLRRFSEYQGLLYLVCYLYFRYRETNDQMVTKCMYLLEYVDNQTLRKFVQTALNRGESYHQLRRAIASINGNQFRGGTDYQIEQWNDCARVIANCIIYYNSALLSGLIEQFEKQNNPAVVEMISNLSPVAWVHIQLAGKYSFGHEKITIDIEQMLRGVDPLSSFDNETLAA